jgi:hypothetical protein
MKLRLLTTAAAVAFAVPAFATEHLPRSGDPLYSQTSILTGDIQLSFGYNKLDGDFLADEKTFWTFNGWTRANVRLNTWNVLVEVGGGAAFGGDIPDGFNDPNFNAFGHVWGGDGVRYGAFGGALYQDITVGVVGVEAEADVGNATLGGQAFFLFSEFEDGWGLRGWGDYYFTPNTKATGDIAWATVDGEDLVALRGRVTHRFAGTPINVFGEATYFTTSVDDFHGCSISGGLSLLYDAGLQTQQEFDRTVPFDFRVPALAGEGAFFSDRRLKTDIEQVGMLAEGIPLYRFRYIWGDDVFVGVMAQDLLAVRPDAVVMTSSGYYAVNYAALGTRMMRWEEWQALGSAGSTKAPTLDLVAAPTG